MLINDASVAGARLNDTMNTLKEFYHYLRLSECSINGLHHNTNLNFREK